MEYYISINNEKRGPYSIEELRARGISAETLVMTADSDTWIPAWQVAELRPVIGKAEQSGSEAPAIGQPANDFEEVHEAPFQQGINYQHGSPVPPPMTDNGHNKGNGCLKAFLIVLIGLLVIVGIAVATCPDEKAHKAALSDVAAQLAADEVTDKDSDATNGGIIDQLFQKMGASLLRGIAQNAVDELIVVDDHTVYSTGKVRVGGKEHTVSVGVFGHVFTVDKDDLKAATKRYYDKAGLDAKEQIQQKASEIIQQNVVDPAIDEAKKHLDDIMNEVERRFGVDEGQLEGDDGTQQSDSSYEGF